MPTIEMSPSFGVKQVKRFMGLTDAVYSAQMKYNSTTASNEQDAPFFSKDIGGNGYYFNTWINIMKGAIPGDFVDLQIPGGTGVFPRREDILISISNGNGDIYGFDITNSKVDANPCTIQTLYKAAVASGLATWFWITTLGGTRNVSTIGNLNLMVGETPYPNHYENYWIMHQAFGTVGLVGSGSDLEIPNTNIVTGTPYRVSNLKIKLPTLWTY